MWGQNPPNLGGHNPKLVAGGASTWPIRRRVARVAPRLAPYRHANDEPHKTRRGSLLNLLHFINGCFHVKLRQKCPREVNGSSRESWNYGDKKKWCWERESELLYQLMVVGNNACGVECKSDFGSRIVEAQHKHLIRHPHAPITIFRDRR
jgi:hypothetical protein